MLENKIRYNIADFQQTVRNVELNVCLKCAMNNICDEGITARCVIYAYIMDNGFHWDLVVIVL